MSRPALVGLLFLMAFNLCPSDWLRAGLAPVHSLFSSHPCTLESAEALRRTVNSVSVALLTVTFVISSLRSMPPALERFLVLGTCPCIGVLSQMPKSSDVTMEDVTFLLKRSNRMRSRKRQGDADVPANEDIELIKCGNVSCHQEDRKGWKKEPVVEVADINREVKTSAPRLERERLELDDLSKARKAKAVEDRRREEDEAKDKMESRKKVKELVSRLTNARGVQEQMKEADKIELSEVCSVVKTRDGKRRHDKRKEEEE